MAHRTDTTGKVSTAKDSAGKDSAAKDSTGKDSAGKDSTRKDSTGKKHSGRKGGKGRGTKRPERLALELYEAELFRLQAELVALQEWVRSTGARVLVIFEGRDAAGKGSAIKRVTEYLNPRFARIVALPAPTERQRGEWYFQRYVEHLPAAGEIVLMDRSWYNRAGVEHVMGFCTPAEHKRFMAQCPVFERLLIQDGILMFKYWFSISHAEQERRFKSRLDDPLRQWKLSPMDREAILRWEDYSRAKDDMFMQTDTAESPWFVVEAEDKRRARINMIAHLLSNIDYTEVRTEPVTLPERPKAVNYTRPPRELFRYVPDHAGMLQKPRED
jgi:polyphosphate kinase 2